jgi:hypothetical protein
MEPELIRTYYPTGTNGKIQDQNRLMMASIEYTWEDNPAQVSRIPVGRYEWVRRSLKFSRHLPVMNVSQRENILIHPADDATNERKGCIALVFNNQVFIIIK